ncbi:hypothetical protein ACFRJ1_16595 [Streptomyces sp. NPDC056773]|uniref:hypothetical protein n=1 Tax=unclassified Streptomyces TaxID=2593676 RepID=UPI003686B8FB
MLGIHSRDVDDNFVHPRPIEFGRCTEVPRPAAGGSWTYDGEGNCLTRTDGPDDRAVRFEYTHFDLLTAPTDADGARHEYTYEAELRLTGVRVPQGMTWEYAYDPADRLVARPDALGRRITHERDALGHTVRKDAAGAMTTFAPTTKRETRRPHPGPPLTPARMSSLSGQTQPRAASYSQSRFLKMTYRLTQTTAISKIAKG